MQSAPPTIFSPGKRLAARRRIAWLQRGADPARFVIADMVEDTLERLAFLGHEPRRALVIGDWTGALAAALGDTEVTEAEPGEGFDEEQPYPFGAFDLVASVATLDTVNDLPGALIHMRRALAPGGRAIA